MVSLLYLAIQKNTMGYNALSSYQRYAHGAKRKAQQTVSSEQLAAKMTRAKTQRTLRLERVGRWQQTANSKQYAEGKEQLTANRKQYRTGLRTEEKRGCRV